MSKLHILFLLLLGFGLVLAQGGDQSADEPIDQGEVPIATLATVGNRFYEAVRGLDGLSRNVR